MLQAHTHISGNSSIHCQFESITGSCLCIHLLWSTIATSLWALVYLFPTCMRNILLKLNKSTNCVVRHDLRFNQTTHFSIAYTHSQIQTHFRPLYEYMCIICIKLWFFLCVCAVVGVCVFIQFGVVVVGSSVACTLISIAA